MFEYLVKKNNNKFNFDKGYKHQIETSQLMNEISNNVKADIMMWRFKLYQLNRFLQNYDRSKLIILFQNINQ